MRYILLILIPWLIANNCYSQGSWDIDYVEIDSLNSNYLNIPIKLDFKHDWMSIKKPEKMSIRHYVLPEDTAYLLINNRMTVFIERRAIYVDHGSFNDQFLEIENYNKKISLQIYNTEILQLEEGRIKIKATILTFRVTNKNDKEELDSEAIELWVDRDKLDGIMIKK